MITKARAYLLDSSAVSGNVMTNSQYLEFVNDALVEIIQNVRALEQFRVTRDFITQLPKNVSFLAIDTISAFPDFGYALEMWQRPEDSFQAISGVWSGAGTWTVTISSTANMVRGQNVQIYGVLDPHLNGSYTVLLVNDGTHFSFVGPSTASYSGQANGGVVSFATSVWNPVYFADYIPGMPLSPLSGVDQAAFINGGIQMMPVNSDRQFRMRYATGGYRVASTTDVLDIPEALTSLGLSTAIRAGNALSMDGPKFDELKKQLYGDSTVGAPGALRLLKRHYSLQRQNQQIKRPLWRPRSQPGYSTLVRT